MANRKLSALIDAFTTPTIDSTVWGVISAGAVALDTVNDEVTVTVPTAAATSNIGTTTLYDATGSSIYARVTAAANGAGNVRTILRLRVDANNSMSLRVESGILKQTSITAGVTTSVTLPAYDAHAHRWWRLREAAGLFYADVSADGLNWTNVSSMAYTYDVTAITVRFEAVSTATEVAGNVATLANVNTRAGGPVNPNWPKIEDGWAPYWNANAGTMPIDRYVEVSDRTRGTVSVQRGRQYETDQVRSGEASLRLANPDAALDPVNTAGPWAGHIAPYQPYRRRAQWPASRNLLDQSIATGGDVGPYPLGPIPTSAAGPSIFSTTDTTGGSFVASPSAWQGGTVMQFAVPSGSAAAARPCHTPRWSVLPGQTYTVQMRVRNVTASTSLNVQAFFGWYPAGGGAPSGFIYGTSSVLTGSTTAGWTTITATVTAPATAAGMDVGVALASTAAATANLQVDGWQLEKGTVASTWTCPGKWWGVYAGWTERWPSGWDMDGLYGYVEPTAADTFSLLSQQQLDDALTMELNANNPRFVYKLDDPSGSTSVTDWTGNYPPAQIGIGKYGAGSVTFGSAITATDPVNGTYTGSGDTVATVSNSNPGTNLITGGASFIKLGSAGIVGPADPTGSWTRMFAFRYTGPTPTSLAVMWSAFDRQRGNGNPSGSQLYCYLDTGGSFNLVMQGPTGLGSAYRPTAVNVADSNWHLVSIAYSHPNATLIINLDGTNVFWTGINPATEPTGLVSDNVGGWVDPTVGNGTTFNFKGDLSFISEFPSALSTTAMTNIYSAWRSACTGESSTARYARILRYAGFNGVSNLQTGLTTAMGPANIAGQDAVSALNAVVESENGAHFVDAAGGIQFRSRGARYNALTPMFVFGERADLGEWPYEDCTLDYDSTHLSNSIAVQQEGTGQTFYAADAASIAAYFTRPMSRTLNVQNGNEVQDASYYLLSRYRQPAQRVSSLKLHPAANPALWPVCLALELGTRVRVMRRAPGVPPISIECFVENIQWTFDDTADAELELQCSPADLTPYGVFAAWHTTMAASYGTGFTSVQIAASADNTTLLSQQIAPGQQLVLSAGTANAETVTVQAVGATSPGWTIGTITLTAPTTKAHVLFETVCEPLPAGVTDPATWDSVAMFDSIAFAY
ncbi:hypothetical protein ACIA7S_28350 [Streptomyces sp. NPDC051643]|uniref:hypothetical protein n=1 Tax=Streptomyces sp. NPDC051643 TaxID=3365665 RepID=UPI0037917A2C